MKRPQANIPGLATLLLLLTAAWGPAQGQGQIQLKSVVEVAHEVITAAGHKEIQRMPADKVVPGTQLLFTTYYEQMGTEAVENTVITIPIPAQTLYTDDSAQGTGTRITFSIDGGRTYDAPAMLFIADPSGRQYPVRPRDYTHIRWTFENPLAPGTKGAVSFRAILR